MSQKLFISEFDVLIVEVDFLPIGPRFKTRYCQPIIIYLRMLYSILTSCHMSCLW